MPRCQDSPSKIWYNDSKWKDKLNMFSKVKPKECQVEAVHKVATWYSDYRLRLVVV